MGLFVSVCVGWDYRLPNETDHAASNLNQLMICLDGSVGTA